jgi:metal-responsive CopG/Arc/MetJ family transcriptional regulator
VVRVVVDIPNELVNDIEDIMNTYELTIDEFVVTAIRRLMKKRTRSELSTSEEVARAIPGM